MTPLERAPEALADHLGQADVWLKREDVHELGAFKWRSTLPVVRQLAADGHEAVVTSSTGNHGAAVSWACRQLGVRAIVFVPPDGTRQKLALLERLGADVRVAGGDLDGAKERAREIAAADGLPFFEDGAEPLQYEAYAAIADEILDQSLTPPAAVVMPVGNGALAGGVGAALATRAPGIARIGVVSKEMPVMAASWEAGRPVEVPSGQTIADGMAVRIAIPLAVERLRTAVDAMVQVSERAIAAALVACHDAGVRVEPSAAAAVAAVREHPPPGPVVLVLTGSNLDEAILDRARRDLDSFPE